MRFRAPIIIAAEHLHFGCPGFINSFYNLTLCISTGDTIDAIENALQKHLLPICRGTRLRLMTLDTNPANPHLVVVSQAASAAGKNSAGKVTLSLAGVSVAAMALRLKRLVHDDRGQCDDEHDGMADDSLEHR